MARWRPRQTVELVAHLPNSHGVPRVRMLIQNPATSVPLTEGEVDAFRLTL